MRAWPLRLGHRYDAVWRRRLQPPGGVTGFNIALGRETQDHFLCVLIRHRALQYAVEYKILLHLVDALVQQAIAFLTINDRKIRLQRGHLAVPQILENGILFQLDTDDVFFGMACYGGHGELAVIEADAHHAAKIDPGQ